MFRKSVRLWAFASLTVLLASCLPSSEVTPTVSPPSPTVSLPTTTPTAAASGPLVVTLTLWVPEELSPYSENPEAGFMAQQLDDFGQAYPNVQVEVIVKKAEGRGGLWDFLRTASVAAPSVLPDLVVLDAGNMQLAAQANLLQPLDSLLPANVAGDRFPFAVEMGQIDEQTMGIPIAVELDHLVYRPAMLPSVPVSWTDVLSSGVSLVFPAAEQGDLSDMLLIQYLGAGGHLTDGEGNPQLEVEPLQAVLEFYAQAVAADVISPTVVFSLQDTDACWEQLFNWQAEMAVVNSRRFWTEADPLVAPAPIPTREGRTIALADGWILSMVAVEPSQQEQAIQLMAWLLDPQEREAWTQGIGYLPTTRSGLAAWATSEENRSVLETLLEGARSMPPAWEIVASPIQAALKAVLEDRRSPASAAIEAVQAVNSP